MEIFNLSKTKKVSHLNKTNMLSTESKIESLLFFKGEPMSKKDIIKSLQIEEDDFDAAILSLENTLAERGIVLLKRDGDYTLGTNPELGPYFEAMRKEELSKELSKATLETIAIILYKSKSTRGTIDYIRGVNSSFIIRNLLVRGLIEREQDPDDSRAFVYKPSFQLLEYMGVKSIEELPSYEDYMRILTNTVSERPSEAAES